MSRFPISYCLLFLLLVLMSACANIIPPSGGKTDTTPPKLLSIKPKDSLLNSRVTRFDLKFDEYVTVNDVSKELTISPILGQNPTMTASGKSVAIKIPDSLLQSNTTYTISFGKAIRDLHESNAYSGQNFVFSTGGWFDSLQLKGKIIDASSGKIDSAGGVKILLYDALEPYNIVSSKKPAYLTSSKSDGSFIFNGLPNKTFRIFALKETNESLKFDNDDELVGFADTIFNPSKDSLPIILSIFKELPDSSKAKIDTSKLSNKNDGQRKARMGTNVKNETLNNIPVLDAKTFNYTVLVDTNNQEKRTQNINEPISIYFSRPLDTFVIQKILLSVDSSGIEVEASIKTFIDSTRKKISISPSWRFNATYTLRVLKGFATDTNKATTMPSKYIFRSKSDEDYGQLEINVPNKYVGKNYLLQIKKDNLPHYLEPISSNKIKLKQLAAGTYTILIIEDTNGDSEWTTGELKSKRHAENIIPYQNSINMKAGWEHVVDFETSKE